MQRVTPNFQRICIEKYRLRRIWTFHFRGWQIYVETQFPPLQRCQLSLYSILGAQESIPSLVGRCDNPICRTGPPGYIGGIDSWAA
jgi:hypothetical protein